MDKSLKSMESSDDQRWAHYQDISEKDAIQIAIMISQSPDQESSDTGKSTSNDPESESYKETHNSEEVANEGNSFDASVTPPDHDVDIEYELAFQIATLNSEADLGLKDERNDSSSLSRGFYGEHDSMGHTSDIFPEQHVSPPCDDKFEGEKSLEFTFDSDSNSTETMEHVSAASVHDNTTASMYDNTTASMQDNTTASMYDNTTFINETPPAVLRNILEMHYKHACTECKSEEVSQVTGTFWSCRKCPHGWGYDDSSYDDIQEVVSKLKIIDTKVIEIPPCRRRDCKNSDTTKIRLEYVNEFLEFWCEVCGTGYKLDSEGCEMKGDSSCSGKTDEICGQYSESGKLESRRCLSAGDMGHQPQSETFGFSGGESGALHRRDSFRRSGRRKDDGEVRKLWNPVTKALERSGERMMTNGVRMLGQAISTNTNPKNDLLKFVANEAVGLCTPVCVAVCTMAGTLLFKGTKGAAIGENVGQLVGRALSSFIEEAISGRSRSK